MSLYSLAMVRVGLTHSPKIALNKPERSGQRAPRNFYGACLPRHDGWWKAQGREIVITERGKGIRTSRWKEGWIGSGGMQRLLLKL